MASDLNLMRVFDALMELRSVTRAADRLGLTQSAASHALGRLRDVIGDPLFVRSRTGLQPTPRAEAMAVQIREGLRHLDSALAPRRPDEAPVERRFTIAASAYFCALLIPPLIARARIEAPGYSFRMVPQTGQLVSALDRGAVDLTLGSFTRVPGRFVAEPLYVEELVWIAAADSALARAPFDARRIAAAPRVVIAARPFEAVDTIGDETLLAAPSTVISLAADTDMMVYDSLTAVAVVARTDLVALVPNLIAVGDPRVAVLGSAEGESAFELDMLYHARQSSDPDLLWLRRQLKAVAAATPRAARHRKG